MSARAFAATLAALALIGLLAFGLGRTGSADVEIGDAAPSAELPRLGSEGSAGLADYRGKWVLVNFWASWCNPCRDESPALQEFSRQHDGEVVVLGINTQDLTDDALAFVAEFDLTYPMLRDPDTESPLSDEYGATGLPESFLVDPGGRFAVICRGPVSASDLGRVIVPVVRGERPSGRESICGVQAA